MSVKQSSKYLTDDWKEEIVCFNCNERIECTQDDIVILGEYDHGIICPGCSFPLELSSRIPPVILNKEYSRGTIRCLDHSDDDVDFDESDTDGNDSNESDTVDIDGSDESRFSRWWNQDITCKTCLSKLRIYANHINVNVKCPACDRSIGFRFYDPTIRQKFSDKGGDPHNGYVDEWSKLNGLPVGIIELSQFVDGEWKLERECEGCRSILEITSENKLTLQGFKKHSRWVNLATECKGCHYHTTIHTFEVMTPYCHDDYDYSDPEYDKSVKINDWVRFHSNNYDAWRRPDDWIPPILFWRTWEATEAAKSTPERCGCVIL